MSAPAPVAKICGLVRREDAEVAAAAGAAFGGVILAQGYRRSLPLDAASALLAGLPLRRVGVFVNPGTDEVRRAADRVELEVVQLSGEEDLPLLRALRSEGRWRVWKAVRPRTGAEFLEALERFAGEADGLLLDGFSAGTHGGTGTRFPWEEVAEHRARVPAGLSLIVAGGLGPANVARAAALLRPDVVDVSSGVESAPGAKDPDAVRAFVAASRLALDPEPNH